MRQIATRPSLPLDSRVETGLATRPTVTKNGTVSARRYSFAPICSTTVRPISRHELRRSSYSDSVTAPERMVSRSSASPSPVAFRRAAISAPSLYGRFDRSNVVVPASFEHLEPRRLERVASSAGPERHVRVHALEVGPPRPSLESAFRVDARVDLDRGVVGFDGRDEIGGDACELLERGRWIGEIDQECLTDHEIEGIVGKR